MNTTVAVSSHDRILFAGKRLFALHGYENTSTVAIAREAGTSESQLMKHFGSKQGLLFAILERGWASIIERLEATRSAGTPAERLLRAMEAVITELQGDSELKELMMLEACRVRKDSREVLTSRGYRKFADILSGLLGEMRKEGQLREDVNLDAMRAALVGVTEGLLRDQVIAGRSEFRADYSFDDIRKVLEVMIPALGPSTPPPKAVPS